MHSFLLIQRNLTYYWRTHLAVLLGVATAVAVLAGALLVGDSVRASLRDLFLLRLGNTAHVISTPGFFREKLAQDLESHHQFGIRFNAATPLIALEAFVIHQESGRRGSGVHVYGVDDRFWKFHEAKTKGLDGREALLSPSLAQELESEPGDSLLIRVEKPSPIPVESLHGRKEDVGRTIRLSVREVLPAYALGEFSIRPRQGSVRAIFVALRRLQRDLGQEGNANTILVSDKGGQPAARPPTSSELKTLLRDSYTLSDLGIKLRVLEEQKCFLLESSSGVIDDTLAERASKVADKLNMRTLPVLTYLANVIRHGQRQIPYSLITATRLREFDDVKHSGTRTEEGSSPSPIWLNEWAARDLDVRPGESLSVEYYLWKEEGQLLTETTEFELSAILPIEGAAADLTLTPEYPGITDASSVAEWDPPFPIDLGLVRPRDEEYWDRYRTTPKGFIPLERGQALWSSRFGKLTSLRIFPSSESLPRFQGGPEGGESMLHSALESYQSHLGAALDPTGLGFSVYPAKAQGLEASRGATDFGEYFLYFSFFLVLSALLLAGLFFKLGVEQRLREIGILQALGFPAARIRTVFISEGLVLSAAGSVLGMVGAWGYGALIMLGLRTWWVDSVGTRLLSVHVSPTPFLLGGVGGVLTALACIVWTLRTLAPVSPRSLLTGTALGIDAQSSSPGGSAGRSLAPSVRGAIAFSLLALFLLLAAFLNWITQAAGFFGAGTLLLGSLLFLQSSWLRRSERRVLQGAGWRVIWRFGFRNATYRPGRSLLCIALIASATFIIVAVDAFKRDEATISTERKSGSGGFPLLAESLLPLVHDPNTAQGRQALNLAFAGDSLLQEVTFDRFRIRPGDDTSCLNLYRPRNPRVLAPTTDFVKSGRFTFQDSLAETQEEKENPWLLLDRETGDGAIPIIADANSMTYVLHLELGDDFAFNPSGGRPVRMRLVGALANSVFQGELLMSERHFLRLFPTQDRQASGYRFFLIDLPVEKSAMVAAALEERLSDFGFDALPTRERLAAFHRVENTYLNTFQTLGGLGLILGTLGLATVLLRNIMERRRELALLRAVGYGSSHLAQMVIAENGLLLSCGLATGTVCALLAIAPASLARGGHLPTFSLSLLLAVLITGLAASLLATAAALRSPLLPSLRAE